MNIKFKSEGLNILQWEVDKETIHLARQLTESGVALNTAEQPELQPILEGFKKMNLLWIVLRWTYTIYDVNHAPILKYIAEDKYKVEIRPATSEEISKLLKQSYDHLIQGFDLMNKNVGISPGIRSLEPNEFDQSCQSIKQFLKERNL